MLNALGRELVSRERFQPPLIAFARNWSIQ
jgi:hypothetical protein